MNGYNTMILDPQKHKDAIDTAVKLLRNGEIVGIPTETVYGLAGNALLPSAVRKIFEAKGRPQNNPLIIHVSCFEMVEELTREIPSVARKIIGEFFPGPLTMILPKSDRIPLETNCGLDTVAVRMPKNQITLELIEKCGFPLAAPSANTSGRPSPTSANHVFHDLSGKIPLIIDGGECVYGLESTVVAFIGGKIRLLRPGAVTLEMLSEYGVVELDKAVLNEHDTDEVPISPGTAFTHYAPKAELILIKAASKESFNDYVQNKQKESGKKVVAFIEDEENQPKIDFLVIGGDANMRAKNIYSKLRQADEAGAEIIYAYCAKQCDTGGMELAVYNRLLRASGFKIIEI